MKNLILSSLLFVAVQRSSIAQNAVKGSTAKLATANAIPSTLSNTSKSKPTFIKDNQILEFTLIEAAYDMTTHLIFPSEISYVDLGSDGIIAEKADKVGNVLKLKANKKNFQNTNLTVITADGKFFSFMVMYKDYPRGLNIKLGSNDFTAVSRKIETPNSDSLQGLAFFEGKMNEAAMNKYSYELAKKKRSLKHIGQSLNKIEVIVRNLYVKDNILFFELYFRNRSNVNYDIDFIKFYVQDQGQLKRTTQQQLEVEPVYVVGQELQTLAGKTSTSKVYCFQRFTIPDKKIFTIEVFEKNGGRKISFNLSGKDIIGAKSF